ncbi:NtaA/DmoA family FMN-dependent monooxygenase [Nocardia sp. alder85J]|uniref:NtaA/DmoA family FMN-dependent monooxygenase n=1 Tax=Nocardia sp. alder85J TaxID=2862949 RepID=UPI001CD211CC|nr:NtaA/DmoA family FMN-dependent monooxygenase [Nocardia sp. alder85J]MCX4098188.1 NtaA/DmoA family FMN-dependent monooxygenase [Nocardia sp. alder85J]
MAERTLHLNVNVIGAGMHPAAWRLPGGNPRAFFDPAHYARVAAVAEAGLFDSAFLADNSYLHPQGYPNSALDPIVTLAAMAAATSRIGLIGSYSTTFHQPYAIARAFASLDHFSGGRIGWNIVTSRNKPEGHNYGFTELPDRATRYARAVETVEVVTALWDSWRPGALVLDTAAGLAVDRDLVTPIDHVGEHHSVAGPFQVPPSPQGRPLLTQAGASEGGADLAARFADAVFTSALFLEPGLEYAGRLRKAVVQHGRSPDSIAVMPGINPVIGSTEAEARRRIAEHDEIAGPPGDPVTAVAAWTGVDPAALTADRPVPLELLVPTGNTYSSVGFDTSLRLYLERNAHRTVRELARDGRPGHRSVIGSAEQVADDLEHWFRVGAADGFVIQFDTLPGGLELFVEHVVPLLQKKGIFRREYSETTLRDRFGVPYPGR